MLAGERFYLYCVRRFMLVGLYSEVARRISYGPAVSSQRGNLSLLPEQIRQCVRRSWRRVGGKVYFASQAIGLLSISTCRDLLFHVQECYVTLAGIDDYLACAGAHASGF